MVFRHRLDVCCRVQGAARVAHHAGAEAVLKPRNSCHCSGIESSGSAAVSRSENCGRNAAHQLCGDSDRKLGGVSRHMAEDCSLQELLHPWQSLSPAQVCQRSFAALSQPYFPFTQINNNGQPRRVPSSGNSCTVKNAAAARFSLRKYHRCCFFCTAFCMVQNDAVADMHQTIFLSQGA